ncbi:hypothetical protein HNR46_002509 [Haloferula luteola]|uniref:Uncharacterized protein n=1 Tax=Haloferula luteola TaxID=595692 RepID=A0A840V5G1_9BACT|nr:hypothetical protein [Haloferula luteola]MBB5352266.1 hypothetical protein [Haloferula luteola]
MIRLFTRLPLLAAGLLLCQCAGTIGTGNMGGPTTEERQAAISSEAKGDYFVGRRYYVQKTRFWGYLRRPRESWDRAQLVLLREDKKHAPDRLPENGPSGQRYGFDQNYEYKIRGYYTGKKAYDPNSNQILPEFMLTGYELIQRQPGWLFRPDDRYDSARITLYPR